MYNHFSTIASKYQNVRTLDTKPILHIKEKLAQKEKIKMADVGCGDGRYSLELLKEFEDLSTNNSPESLGFFNKVKGFWDVMKSRE